MARGTCRKCGRAGHSSGECWFLTSANGRTLGDERSRGGGWGDESRKTGSRAISRADSDCRRCGREGHSARDCWFLTHIDGQTLGERARPDRSYAEPCSRQNESERRWSSWSRLAWGGRWDATRISESPAIYELAVSRNDSISDEDVVYVGETVCAAERMSGYGEHGSHLSSEIELALKAGFRLYCRVKTCESKMAAIREEQRMLRRFCYVWNIKDNLLGPDDEPDHRDGRCGRCDRLGHRWANCSASVDAAGRPLRPGK